MEYGLIGEHLGHSYSKIIQEKMIDNYTYTIHEVSRDDLDSFMTKKEFKAINVTIPYKKSVIPYLETMDEAAKKIGAINTIVNKDGKLEGHNTDYFGFKYMVEKHYGTLEDKKVLVLGNGGAAQAIKAVVQDLHAKEMIICNRTITEGVLTLDEVYEKHTDIQVIMNTTPVGMYPNIHENPVDISKFKQCEAVFDCIYNPMETEFTLQAKQLGIKVAVSGLEMLVGQAKQALEFFKDITLNDEIIDTIYRDILAQTSNCIVLTKNIDACKEASDVLNKSFDILKKDSFESQCIQSNALLVLDPTMNLSKEDQINCSRNSFMIKADTKEEIIQFYKEEIQKYNH